MAKHAAQAENITGGMDFWLVRTTVDIAQTGVVYPVESANPDNAWPFLIGGVTYANATAYNAARTQQRNFNLMVEVLSYQAQPVILGHIIVSEELTPVFGIPSTNANGSGEIVDLHTVRMAIEHVGGWDATNPLALLDNIGPFRYSLTDPSENNIHAVKSEVL